MKCPSNCFSWDAKGNISCATLRSSLQHLSKLNFVFLIFGTRAHEYPPILNTCLCRTPDLRVDKQVLDWKPNAQKLPRTNNWLDQVDATCPDRIAEYAPPEDLLCPSQAAWRTGAKLSHGSHLFVYLFITTHVPLLPLHPRFLPARPLISINSPPRAIVCPDVQKRAANYLRTIETPQ